MCALQASYHIDHILPCSAKDQLLTLHLPLETVAVKAVASAAMSLKTSLSGTESRAPHIPTARASTHIFVNGVQQHEIDGSFTMEKHEHLESPSIERLKA